MRERIKQFMDFKGINASDLAAALEVQRSNISHILNGRNLPGAAFIEKLLATFPELNARWLFLGTGKMTETGEGKEELKAISGPVGLTSPSEAEKKREGEEPAPTPGQRKKPTEPAVTVVNIQPKEAEKIIVLYSDKTFSAYRPE